MNNPFRLAPDATSATKNALAAFVAEHLADRASTNPGMTAEELRDATADLRNLGFPVTINADPYTLVVGNPLTSNQATLRGLKYGIPCLPAPETTDPKAYHLGEPFFAVERPKHIDRHQHWDVQTTIRLRSSKPQREDVVIGLDERRALAVAAALNAYYATKEEA